MPGVPIAGSSGHCREFRRSELPTVAGTSDAHGDHPIHGASNHDTHSYKEDRGVEREIE